MGILRMGEIQLDWLQFRPKHLQRELSALFAARRKVRKRGAPSGLRY